MHVHNKEYIVLLLIYLKGVACMLNSICETSKLLTLSKSSSSTKITSQIFSRYYQYSRFIHDEVRIGQSTSQSAHTASLSYPDIPNPSSNFSFSSHAPPSEHLSELWRHHRRKSV